MSLQQPSELPPCPFRIFYWGFGRTYGSRREGNHAPFLWLWALPVMIAWILLCGGAAGADIGAALGDTVHLSGYSYGSSSVYLFLTGPNLPVNGVALHDVTLPADQGGLTRVAVDDHDRWKYDWGTHGAGGRLDEGTYTIWITTEPVDRSGLRAGEYRTLSVALHSPGHSLAGPVQPGAISLHSSPPGASVMVNDQYRGKTPLDLTDLSPGTYNATLSYFGYRPETMKVIVEPGSTNRVNATLVLYSGSLAIATSPPGARVLLDGRETGLSPVLLRGLLPGSHTVSAEFEGYNNAEEPVTVIPDQTVNVSLILAPSRDLLSPPSTSAGSHPAGVLLSGAIGILFALVIIRCKER